MRWGMAQPDIVRDDVASADELVSVLAVALEEGRAGDVRHGATRVGRTGTISS